MREDELKALYKKKLDMEKVTKKVAYRNMFRYKSFWMYVIGAFIIFSVLIYMSIAMYHGVKIIANTYINNKTLEHSLITNQTLLVQYTTINTGIAIIIVLFITFIFIFILFLIALSSISFKPSKKERLDLAIRTAKELKKQGYTDAEIKRFILND